MRTTKYGLLKTNCFRLIIILFATLSHTSQVIAQEYVVAGDFDYAPFSYIDEAGNPSGLDVDILEAIFDTNDIQLNFQLSRWDRSLEQIESGEADIIIGIIFSKEREEILDFTIPIHTEYYSIFTRKGLSFKGLHSLYNHKPVVLNKDISIEKYLVPMGLMEDYVLANSLPEAFSVLEAGMADYVLAPNLLGLNVIENNRYQNIEIRGPSIIPSIYCLAVKKGDSELLNVLNDGIMELRRDGRLTDIQQKWMVYEDDDFRYKRIASIIWIIISISVGLLILVSGWVWLLRMQIRKKTESINLKNQELQKSEEKFRVITENSSDIIWHLDSNFRLTYISPADERIRGFKKEEVIGQSLFSILKPEGIELLKEANRKRMLDLSQGIRSAPSIYELEEICKDGSWVWVEATADALYDSDGKVSGYHGVTRDISERKKAELLLKERESQLRELNSTKDKLFSIIAHDLRSPFNAILGLSDLLIQKPADSDDTESEECLKMIHSSAENTLTLLDNLLTWAQSQTGHSIYSPEPVNLHSIITDVQEGAESIAKIKDIAIQVSPMEEVKISADVNMLKTILRNLISNAIKYTHANGVIEIFSVRNQSYVEITISDNGIGMSEDAQEQLFEMDTNSTTVGTANEKGTGLGLILCKEFVEKHGGEIRVESELGKGSAFIFSLPLSA